MQNPAFLNETKNLNEVREALEQTVDIIMLDNMSMDSIYESVNS